MKPDLIAIVLRKIEMHVRNAIAHSGCNPDVFALPFPGFGHQNRYIEQLCELVCAYAPPKIPGQGS